jgi:hypothetical protein
VCVSRCRCVGVLERDRETVELVFRKRRPETGVAHTHEKFSSFENEMKLAWVFGGMLDGSIFMNENVSVGNVRDKSREIFFESGGGVVERLGGLCGPWRVGAGRILGFERRAF